MKRIVIKVGTSTLAYPNGKLNLRHIDLLSRAIADLMNRGMEVVLVSSGAIGAGVGKLNLPSRPTTMRGKQALAAVGQTELMQLYSKLFEEYGQIVAQVLLTRDVVDDPHRRENAVNTFEELIERRIIPIVNENDTIAYDEIVFGDNDTLSAVVAGLVRAELLIILSDIDGLYDCDPHQNPQAKIIPYVCGITDEIKNAAGGAGSAHGTGGMITKIHAAEMANGYGVDMVIANGSAPDAVLYRLCDGERIGTLFACKKEDVQ